jgi:hypothetical protein
VPTAAVPPLLRRGVFERDSSGEVLVLVVEEGARIFAREDAVGEVRREVGEEVDPGRDLRVGGFEFGFGVEDDARSDAVGLEEEEEGRRPEVPVRDAVGETDEGRERVACRGGCEVKGEGEGDPDFWTVPLTEGDLREVSGDERRGEEGFAFPEAGGPPPTGLWDGLLLLLLLLSLSVFGRGAREEADGSGERGRAGPIVAVIAVFVGGDGLRAAVAGGTSSSDASPAGSASDAEVGGMFGKGFSSAGETGPGASAASAVKGSSPSPSSVPPAASSLSTLAGCKSDDFSSSRASIVASVGASCMSGNASRADWRFV